MKNSKKGITLVELVICCGILVLLGAGATTLLLTGQNAYHTGAKATASQMDVSVVQTHLLKVVPSASAFTISPANAESLPAGHCIFFKEAEDGSKVFTIRSNGTEIAVDSVSSFTYQLIRAGETPEPVEEAPETPTESTEGGNAQEESSSSAYARPQFVYTIRTTDGKTFDGGFLLCNFSYERLISQLEAEAAVANRTIDLSGPLDLATYPVAFSIPAPTNEPEASE